MDRERGLLARLADPPSGALPAGWRRRETFEVVGALPVPVSGITTFFYAPDNTSASTPIAAIQARQAFVVASVGPQGLVSAEDIAQFAAATGLEVLSLSAEGSAVGLAWPQQVDQSLVEAFASAIA